MGQGFVDAFGRGFESTRRLFVDAENKKAAQALGQQLASEMREWDNQTTLKEAELAQLEEHAMADGEVDNQERNLLKAQRAKIETGRFDTMMNRLSQITAEQATNPYIEQMVKPLFEQTTSRMQKFYNQTAQEFEEHNASKNREAASQQTATEQQGAWDRANLGEQGALDRVLAAGEQDRLTQAEGAKLGIGRGAQKTLSIAPDKLEELANANVDSTYAKEIAAGSFTPEMRQTALRMSRRDLVRTYSRAGVEFNEGALDEPGAEGGGEASDEVVNDINELSAQRGALEDQRAAAKNKLGETRSFKGPFWGNKEKREQVHQQDAEAKAEIADYESEINEIQKLIDDLRGRAVKTGRDKDKETRERISKKYSKDK